MRVFVYDGREFPDPDPEADVEEVKKRMSDFFPELANAEVKEAARGEDTLYEFVRKVGTKG
jgi:PRTRC genetic system protein C